MNTSHTPPALVNYRGARKALLAAMLADYREGASANSIASTVAEAWSRPVTLAYLSCWVLREDAHKALTVAGLADFVDVRTVGDLSGSREVHIQISCDPLDTEPEIWSALPGRIESALTAAGIGWTVPDDSPERSLLALLDDVETAQLHRVN